MKLLTLLKQLHTIEPDKEYVARSRAHILATPRSPRRALLIEILMHSIESGSAIALAGLVLVAVVGGVSLMNQVSPLGLSSLDPAGLKAEADAVDIQIQLTDLNYREPQELPVSTPSVADRIAPSISPVIVADDNEAVPEDSVPEAVSEPAEQSEPGPSIDELLEQLSQ
ncbi:MAG: hypothetical protein Q7S28_04275 [bacterium]|nr:hypothetical protein [bacterium]